MLDKHYKFMAEKYGKTLESPYDALLETLGYDGFSAVLELFGGSHVYVPSKRKLFWKCIEEEIKEEFDGLNMWKIRQKYSVSEATILKLTKGKGAIRR